MPLNYGTENIKRWKLDELTSIVDEFENQVFEKLHILQLKTAEDYMNILLRTAGKSIITMREIICLSSMGYPDGALSLSRNLYEQFILIGFFENHRDSSSFQDYIDDFFVDYDIQRYNALLYEVKGIGSNSELQSKLENERNWSKRKAHHKVNGDYWWTGKRKFKDLVLELQHSQSDEGMRRFLVRLHLMYKRACTSLHASCMGNTIRLGIKPEFAGIDTSPLVDGHSLPLYLATSSFVLISGAVCNELQIKHEDLTKRLNELLIFFMDAFRRENNNA